MYNKNPGNTPLLAGAIPVVKPGWDPNVAEGLVHLNYYQKCILVGLRQGVPKQKRPNKVQEIQQKLNEDPSECLQRIYQAY